MLTSRYMTSVKNLPGIMKKIVDGAAPEKFTLSHLKGIGFKSSNDQGIIPVLKDLGFLTADGVPTERYHAYRDKSKSRAVMSDALRKAYEDLFHINENLTEADRDAIHGRFKSAHNTTDRIASEQTKTFLALLDLADLSKSAKSSLAPDLDKKKEEIKPKTGTEMHPAFSGLRYNIEIHLPPTKEVEVYNAIFKSLKEHLLDA
jgi:hypothetical protein